MESLQKNKKINSKSKFKVLESIWNLKDTNKIVKNELDSLLSRLESKVEIEYMINGKVYWFHWDEGEQLFYTNIGWTKYESKSTKKVIDSIYDNEEYKEYDIYEALHKISVEKKDIIKTILTEEIVSSRDDVEYSEEIEHLDIKQLIEEYYKPNTLIKELDRIHNKFFSIWKWSILNIEDILLITNDVQGYWEEMTSTEKEIGAYFIVVRAGEYNHSFVKIDVNTYECIYSYVS